MGKVKVFFRYLLGIFFFFGGIGHFYKPELYLKMMPPYIPFPLAMIYISGFFESLFGLGVLIPKTTRWAAWGIILLLIAIFPANLHMALHPDQFPEIPYWGLLLRLPFQAVFIFWAYVYTKKQ
ncbi:MAG: DoxX family protein [bacterium]